MPEPRRAATVVPLFEPSGGPPELLWARRTDDAPALAGFHVVPGGLVDRDDGSAPQDGAIADGVTALRELFEEVGLLWASGAERMNDHERRELRELFTESAAAGHARMRALGLAWRTSDLVDIGRWVTPSYAPARFDTQFFALRLPARIEPDADTFELEDATWIDAPRALERWSKAEVLVAPPLALLLRSLTRDGRLVPEHLRAARGARGDESHRWEVVPWVQMLPLRTPTLPPATHTNSFLVGSGEAVLIEPATPYADQVELTARWVEESRAAGIDPIALVATHHHPDHVGGAKALASRLGLPLWGHRLTAARLEGELRFDRLLEDGERIELDGPEPIALSVVHTPGHAPGHVCLLEERSGAMIAGDMVAGIGTILVDPHDGDMAEYLASLERMASLSPSTLLPAHGGPLRDPQAILGHYVQHRLARERRVLDALAAHRGPAKPSDLVPSAYDDTPPIVWPLAALSTEAHLVKLERDGLAMRSGAGWIAR